jgi:hypothetical protein
VTDLSRMQQKRLKESFFDEDETIQLKIVSKTNSVTSLIKQSECKLKELTRMETEDNCNE